MELNILKDGFQELVKICKHHLGFQNLELAQELDDLIQGKPIFRCRNYDVELGQKGFVMIYDSTASTSPSSAFLVKISNKQKSKRMGFDYDYEYTPIKEISVTEIREVKFEYSDLKYFRFIKQKRMI